MNCNIIIFLASLSFSFITPKSGNMQVKINPIVQEISINNVLFTKSTSKEEVLKHLGEPNRTESQLSKVRYMIYDNLGLSIDLGVLGTNVESIHFNYNWDKDKRMAKYSYVGSLQIENLVVNENTTSEEIKTNTSIKDMMCIGKTMCLTNPKGSGIAVTIGYNVNSKITQIGFSYR